MNTSRGLDANLAGPSLRSEEWLRIACLLAGLPQASAGDHRISNVC